MYLHEFTDSQIAERHGLNNEPDNAVIENLKFLCENLIQPIRDKFGVVIVSSGYRSPAVNRMAGGSSTSQHVLGQAADLKFVGTDKLKVARWLAQSGLVFDQLILEAYDPANINKGWLHVSLTRGANRQQVMTARFVKGKPQYTKGLPA